MTHTHKNTHFIIIYISPRSWNQYVQSVQHLLRSVAKSAHISAIDYQLKLEWIIQMTLNRFSCKWVCYFLKVYLFYEDAAKTLWGDGKGELVSSESCLSFFDIINLQSSNSIWLALHSLRVPENKIWFVCLIRLFISLLLCPDTMMMMMMMMMWFCQ